MAVAIDIGDAGDIHPKNKQEVGRRLSLAARAIAYGETIPFQGPLFQRMRVEKNQVRLEFSGVGEGLVSGGGGSLEGFTIAGEDGQFVRAEARIEGGTVVVSSSRVDRPRAVRYGWSDNPSCNLYNRAGLPASPFRTDRWPLRDLN